MKKRNGEENNFDQNDLSKILTMDCSLSGDDVLQLYKNYQE